MRPVLLICPLRTKKFAGNTNILLPEMHLKVIHKAMMQMRWAVSDNDKVRRVFLVP